MIFTVSRFLEIDYIRPKIHLSLLLIKFLPNKTIYSSKDVMEAYRQFLAPNQKLFKKVKRKILASLTDMEVDV